MAGKENNPKEVSFNLPNETQDPESDEYKVGDTLIATWMDGEPRSCVVIDISTLRIPRKTKN